MVKQLNTDAIKAFIKNIPNILKKFFCIILPCFLKQSIEVKTNKRLKITGLIITAVLIIGVIFLNRSFIEQEYKAKWLLLAFCMAFPVVIGAMAAFKITIKNQILKKIVFVVLFGLLPIATMVMTECLNRIFIYNMTYMGFAGNYFIILLFYFLAFALTGSIKASIFSLSSIFYGFALTHAYVVLFRGTPFVPMDFLTVTTALNVGGTYDYTPTDIIITGTLLYIFLIVLGIRVSTPKFKKLTKYITRFTMLVFVGVIMGIFYLTNIFANAGIKPDFWNQTRGYRNYGFVYNYVCNTKYLYMSTPQGYDPNAVGEYVDKETTEEPQTVKPNKNTPNIICIMNESLADMSVLGEFGTNEDYMPFMRSLTENTVRGNLYVPVIGAGTSNTEFEFLTGHSTAFLPSGSNAYMLYIKNPIASIVSTLEGQGYSSTAFHPYYASGWNRVNVYNNLGFNSFRSLENLIDISLMNSYVSSSNNPDFLQDLIEQNYPDRSNMLIRQYVSDNYDYKILIEDFEARDKSKPYFMFNVTMQNHGGYTTPARNFSEKIFLTTASKEYTKANRYLSLVKESDLAFQELINYFRAVKAPTVICMFGDHQPSIESAFVSEVLGVSDLSALTDEQEQARHATPFFIWANFDIEEQYIEKLSSNYLAAYLLDIAGVKTTSYNEYLIELSKKLPVIDTVGYIDTSNNYYKWGDNTEYTEALQQYEKIQYNNIFDYENKNHDIFYLEGYTPEEIASDTVE